jgi:ATP-dependent Clp protease ATP-binding subunit ClpC
MIAKVDERLRDKDMGIELTQPAKVLLASHGFDPVLGARPLRRTISREIEDVLSEKILFGELRAGQIVVVDVEGEGETEAFTFTGTQKPPLPEAPRVEATAATGSTATGGDPGAGRGPQD